MLGAPPQDATTAICVGWDGERLAERFAVVEPVGSVDARLGFPGVTRGVAIWKCGGPVGGWAALRPRWMHL